MRLIDADKLKQCYTGTNGCDDKASYVSICAMIDDAPTVLDDDAFENITDLAWIAQASGILERR